MARRKVLQAPKLRARRGGGMRMPRGGARVRRRGTAGIGRRRRGGGAAIPPVDMGGGMGAGEPGSLLGT